MSDVAGFGPWNRKDKLNLYKLPMLVGYLYHCI